jgi:TetR/AcrR family transcriptional repressor of nem operon
MRYPPEQQEKTRLAILAAATRLFKKKGYTGVSIDAIADAAGLTSGALYSQFASKQELFNAVLDVELGVVAKRWAQLRHGGKDALDAAIQSYLSLPHRANAGGGCPVAGLTVDAARCGKSVRAAYEKHFTGVVEQLREALGRSADAAGREPLFAFYALLVGGIVLARSVNDDNIASEILVACHKQTAEIASTLFAT